MEVSSNVSDKPFNMSIEEYRQQLSDQMATILLPVMILLGIYLLLGFVGNGLVFYIYLRKVPPSATRPTILALACFDLLACAVAIPGEILDIRFSYNFMSDALCKVMRLSTFFFLIASGLTLLLVALDRYHKICHPLRNQIKPKAAWRRVGGACVAASVLSALAPLVYANRDIETPTPGVMGKECSTNPAYKTAALAYGGVLLLVLLSVFSIMSVAYILIARRVLRQTSRFGAAAQRRRSRAHSKDNLANCHVKRERTCDADFSQSDTTKDDISVSKENSLGDNDKLDTTANTNNRRVSTVVRSGSSITRRPSVFKQFRKSSVDATTLRTTLMLSLITIMFIISFLPHMILSVVQTATKSLHSHAASNTENILYNVFVRSYFLNTAVNPFIYGFCSPLFRNECRKLVSFGCFSKK